MGLGAPWGVGQQVPCGLMESADGCVPALVSRVWCQGWLRALLSKGVAKGSLSLAHRCGSVSGCESRSAEGQQAWSEQSTVARWAGHFEE